MPSDPSGRQPSGVLVRPAPDFFDDNLGMGGYWAQPPAPHPFLSISLYNDASTGLVLKVYTITSGDDVGLGTFAYQRQGTPLGSLVMQCQRLRFDQGATFGQIWQRVDHGVVITDPYPLPLPPNYTILAEPGFSSQTVGFSHPLWIIPAGYSLVIANANSASTIYASFWFQMAAE